MIPTAIAKAIAQTVLVRNSRETRSTFAITLRPSDTNPGIDANLLSNKIKFDTALVAAEPVPMAIPRSASFNASASLTPSPIMATEWPAL